MKSSDTLQTALLGELADFPQSVTSTKICEDLPTEEKMSC